ncbi:MAG: ATP-binding protein [Bacteroidales bacterium]|nr:ATP-binding protein [Bacteroidales bacterium]MBR0304456.1 ATP-binding protein [Bacteroidales bacterium]
MLIGRDKEKQILQNALTEEYSQFVAVYGRRRVGKTFLIRESYDYKFTFQFTGAANTSSRKQLARFRMALKEHGLTDMAKVFANWMTAFSELKRYINLQPEGKKIIFLDELPWMDAPRSGFLSELESFWNGWASARKDIVFVVCGSATSWMVKKIIKNKGGLHNRLTHRIALKPFSLRLCEELVQSRGIEMTRKQILNGYMIFGGVPYYWSLLQKGHSLTQEIDRLIFTNDGDMYDEFSMLYASLFKKPEPYIKIISLLAGKKEGMTRIELINKGGLEDNGALSKILDDLEWCGFIRGYTVIGKQVKDEIFQLIDHYTLFYYEFIHGKRHGKNFWQAMEGKPQYNNWCGRAFERVCLWHTDQIKHKIGISGVLTNEYAWRHVPKDQSAEPKSEGVQIDLLLDRSDGIIDLCEIKYSSDKYSITEAYHEKLNRRKAVFAEVTKTRKALHTVLITTYGLAKNAYVGDIQNEIQLDDLFSV